MSQPPPRPKIYHITHVDNLPSIIDDGVLFSDAAMIARGGPTAPIGMTSIKERRLRLPVHGHLSDMVSDYVPFYFCPRSVMLYLIYMANHHELTYRGGQGPILHLEADLHQVVEWAEAEQRRWAYSLSNASAVYTQFRTNVRDLHEVNWNAVQARDWRDPDLKEGKQAEFLVHGSFPWSLVSRIGVRTASLKEQVDAILADSASAVQTQVLPGWYY